MSIATEITRLQGAKASLKTAIENKGVTVSSSALLDAYPALVTAIPSGSPEEKDVNFYDYDGTLLYSYTLAEAQALTALPDLPDHSDIGLNKNSQYSGWNWTLAGVKALTDKMSIGANYDTTDSNTHVIIELSDSSKLTLYVRTDGYSVFNINWGDNSEVETTINGTAYYSHTYPAVGSYKLILSRGTNSVLFKGDYNGAAFSLYDVSSKPQISEYEVQDIVKKVFFGHDSCMIGGAFYAAGNNSLSYSSVEYVSLPQIIQQTQTDIVQLSNSLQRCRKLKALVLPPLTLGNTFLEYDNELEFLSFPENATVVMIFDSNYSLEKIYLKTSTYNYGVSGISNQSLTELRLDFTGTSLNSSAFQNNYLLEKAKLPSTLTSLPDSCFKKCYLLDNFEIPSSVTSLGNYCFQNCENLRSITIGSSVSSIGYAAFQNCKSLATVTIEATTPPTLGQYAFSTNYQKKIYVPYSSDHSVLAAYQAATNWSDLASIMEELPE